MEYGGYIANPYIPRIYKVKNVKRETYNTFTLDVEVNDFRFLPGQFNMLYAFGIGEVPISISSDPADTHIISHTVRRVGYVTDAICNLKRGDSIGIRGPFGNPWPIDECKGNDILIVAGGLGLAPLRPLIYHLLSYRSRYGSVELLYGAKTPKDILYSKEIARWRARFDVDVYLTVDKADSNWFGNVGVVTSLLRKVHADPSHTYVFICGPEIMMRFVAKGLLDMGFRSSNIFISMERNMKCAIGLCGHCQFGPEFVCKDGPVFNYDRVARLLSIREV
jgi:NAD(P)H-flavin reductase